MIELDVAAVLFDNDGVLVDSHDDGTWAWRTLSDEYGLDFSVLQQEFVGCRAADTLARHVSPEHLDQVVQRLEDLEVEAADGTPLLPGAVRLLDQLAEARWAVATSATARLAWARWNAAGIEPSVVVTAEDVERGKPFPDPYLAAAKRLGVDASQCVVFEDAPAGGAAAVTAGARVVAVGDTEWDIEPLARVADLSFVDVVIAADDRVVLAIDA